MSNFEAKELTDFLIFFCSEDEELHTDVDKVDAVVDQLKVQGNSFGQSAALSQGTLADTANID